MLVLYKNNAFKMFGEWKQDGDIFVSNLNYKNSYSWYGSGYYGYHEYEQDFYDDYYRYDKEEWDKAWNKGKGDYRGSKLLAKTINNSRIDSKEANDLWLEIIEKEYKYVTDAELDILKQSAEYYTRSTLTLAGYVLGYDYGQSLVWLEDTPVVLDDEEEKDLQEDE